MDTRTGSSLAPTTRTAGTRIDLVTRHGTVPSNFGAHGSRPIHFRLCQGPLLFLFLSLVSLHTLVRFFLNAAIAAIGTSDSPAADGVELLDKVNTTRIGLTMERTMALGALRIFGIGQLPALDTVVRLGETVSRRIENVGNLQRVMGHLIQLEERDEVLDVSLDVITNREMIRLLKSS